MKRTQNM